MKMISKESKKTVTKVTTLYLLIIRELRHNFIVTNIDIVTKVTKVTEKLHAKLLCLSGFEGNL